MVSPRSNTFYTGVRCIADVLQWFMASRTGANTCLPDACRDNTFPPDHSRTTSGKTTGDLWGPTPTPLGATTAEKLRGTKVWVPTPGHLCPTPGQRPGWVLSAGGDRPSRCEHIPGNFLKTQLNC